MWFSVEGEETSNIGGVELNLYPGVQCVEPTTLNKCAMWEATHFLSLSSFSLSYFSSLCLSFEGLSFFLIILEF